MKHFSILCLLLFISSLSPAQDFYFPPLNGTEWDTINPTSLNWCDAQIDALYDYLEAEESKSFLLLKDGKIVLEKYFGTYTQDSLWVWFSAGKSLTATLVGIAQEEGLLALDDQSAQYLGSGWTNLPQEKEELITIWHQLSMSSGMDERIFLCTNPACLRYVADAGTRWAYHNGPYSLLRNVLEAASGVGINRFTNTRIEQKIGMQGFWLRSANGYSSFYASRARDMARFGLMILNEGYWDATPVLQDSSYFQQMVNSSQDLNPAYGLLWWLNGKESYIPPSNPASIPGPIAPNAPDDVLLAAGSQGQLISISPSNGLIMIRQGEESENTLTATSLHDEIWKRINDLSCLATSTENALVAASITIYPNPATDLLQIKSEQAIDRIQLIDLNGKVLQETSNSTSFSIKNQLPGMYFVRIHLEDSWIHKKVIIQ